MKVNIARYYKRERIQLDCEIITPMFLGNANQEAELRAAPFKGLLRYWWRVANGLRHETASALLREENRIFGSADANSGGKSQVTVEVKGHPLHFAQETFPAGQKIQHPEVRNKFGNVVSIDRFLYLGYGPIIKSGQLKKEGEGAFQPGQCFTVIISGREQILEQMKHPIHCFQQFGAIGSRSRNGWGSFFLESDNLQPVSDAMLFKNIGSDWLTCFSKDYPHCLGTDNGKTLLWRSKQVHSNWEEVMNELAGIYLMTRLEQKFQEGGPHLKPQNRHILGYPAGRKHSVKNWGHAGRHGSALRLLVRKEADGYRGYFLHLPHLFSKEMWPGDKERQINIWKQVHAKLDQLCQRVAYQEAGE